MVRIYFIFLDKPKKSVIGNYVLVWRKVVNLLWFGFGLPFVPAVFEIFIVSILMCGDFSQFLIIVSIVRINIGVTICLGKDGSDEKINAEKDLKQSNKSQVPHASFLGFSALLQNNKNVHTTITLHWHSKLLLSFCLVLKELSLQPTLLKVW